MNLKEIKELIELMKNTDISELEIERSGVKVRLRKGGDVTFNPSMPRMEYPPATLVAPAFTEAPAPAPESAAGKPAGPVKAELVKVVSPIVGTFYRSSSPEKPAYVEVGDVVKKGQVLCIIEAMKLMNEIECESAGKITQILVDSGAPVEYGQPLFVIDTE
jgi:acetyl-CoA carboxylase biotin carboxyl carrier protein